MKYGLEYLLNSKLKLRKYNNCFDMTITSNVNTMRILVPTSVSPPKKDLFTTFIDNSFHHIQKRTDSRIMWLIHQPKKNQVVIDNVYDIHDFSDAKNLLEIIKPSCVIISQTYEPINYSISLAANFLKIPLISIYLYDYEFTYREQNKRQYLQYLQSLLRRFFSSKVPTDSEDEKQFMKRGRFMFYKYNFLIKTKKALGLGFIDIIKNLIQDFIMFVMQTYPEYNILADLNLLPNESWYNPLVNYGISEKKLRVTGNPFWDKKYEKIQKIIIRQNNRQKEKINILLLTDALVEHGLWNYGERDSFLKRLFSELKKDGKISFSLKIHPSSENKYYYESLLSELDIKVPIFQSEDLWDVIDNFDLVLSYGTTYAHTELSSSEIRLIILDPKNEFVRQPLVIEGVESGHVVICNAFENLLISIHELLSKKTNPTDEFLKKREKLFFKYDGKSGERVAYEILKITNRN